MQGKLALPLDRIPDDAILAEDVLDDYSHVLMSAGTRLNDESLRLLTNHGIETVSIVWRQEWMIDIPNVEITNNSIFDQRMTDALMEGARAIFPGHSSVVVKVDHLQKIVDDVVAKVSRKANILLHLNDIHAKSDDLYVHSVNVCLFSILIGMSMRLSPPELTMLGIGGLLHDIGKVNVSRAILDKPGKLTADEFEEVKKHVTHGYHMIKQETALDQRVMLMVLQHHERCNGYGYPWGISDEQIHPYAKIVAVADVYEALTANRAYRTRFTADTAIKMLNEKVGEHYDPDVLTAFNKIVVPYNLGEMVSLSNGMTGKVIRLNSANLYRPQLFTAAGKLDLLQMTNLQVVGVVGAG